MKKNMYIQPIVEIAKMQQTQALCVSPVIGGDLPGGTEQNPLDL